MNVVRSFSPFQWAIAPTRSSGRIADVSTHTWHIRLSRHRIVRSKQLVLQRIEGRKARRRKNRVHFEFLVLILSLNCDILTPLSSP